MCCPGLEKIGCILGLGMAALLVRRVFVGHNRNFQLEKQRRAREESKQDLRQVQGVVRLHV